MIKVQIYLGVLVIKCNHGTTVQGYSQQRFYNMVTDNIEESYFSLSSALINSF